MKAEFKHTRLLAAVMFVDIVDYTAIMQKSESEAVRMRSLLRTVLNKQIRNHKGKLIQYYGDGALSIFRSAYEAVHGALNIQAIFRQQSVPVRVGLHQGEIVHSDEGVYGNAVNIASRIENLAQAGGILISEKIYEEIRNHNDLKIREAGSFEFKNVQGALKLFSIIESDAAAHDKRLGIRWRELHSIQIQTVLIRPYLSNTNPGLLN